VRYIQSIPANDGVKLKVDASSYNISAYRLSGDRKERISYTLQDPPIFSRILSVFSSSDSKYINVEKSDAPVEVEYYTPAPSAEEKSFPMIRKK